MNTHEQPLHGRMWKKWARAAQQRHVLLLLALLLLVAAGCAPQTQAGSWAGIGADDDGLILVNYDRVTRLNDVGTARWEFPAAGDRNPGLQFYAAPALTEDTVYVGGFDHKVYAIDRANGSQIWVSEDLGDSIIAGLVIGQGRIYVGLGSGDLVALDQISGELQWRFETEQGVWATPLLVGDVLYVTSLDRHLYAVDAETGDELWRQDLEGAVAGTPVYDNGVLYVGSFANQMFAIDAGNGDILDRFDTANWVWGGPVLAGGLLYFGDLSGSVYAIEADTFAPVWQQQIADSAIRATPLVADDLLIIGARGGQVFAVERENGLPVWTQNAGAPVLSDPVLLDDGLVLVSTLDTNRMLIAYDAAEAGQMVWQYPPAAAAAE